MTTPTEHIFRSESAGVDMRYTVSGSGPALILMHGWGCTAETVESIRQVASETHTVYTVDFPGHGRSGEPPLLPDGKPWGVDRFTLLIEEMADSLGLERPSLIGHSFGGRVAILYSSRREVDKVILVDAAGVKPKRSMSYYVRVYSYKFRKKLLMALLGRERAERRIERMQASKGSADYRSASPMMRRVMSRVVNEDLRKVMPLIKAPTLLIWGEEDTATPLSDARIMAELIPHAGLVSFARCGHYSFLDNPGQFAAVLRSFLNS